MVPDRLNLKKMGKNILSLYKFSKIKYNKPDEKIGRGIML
jgi:hypothetical protein